MQDPAALVFLTYAISAALVPVEVLAELSAKGRALLQRTEKAKRARQKAAQPMGGAKVHVIPEDKKQWF